MTKAFNVGDRVRVLITRPDQWATGAVVKLDGATGTVESVKSSIDAFGRCRNPETPYLVRFDTPVSPWHSNALPHAAFHFDAHDLEALR